MSDVIRRASLAAKGEIVTIEALVHAMGTSSIAAVLLLPALLVVSPLSGVPGVSAAGGVTIALVAGQIAFGRDRVWLPGWLLRRGISAQKLRTALAGMRSPARRVDGLVHERGPLPRAVLQRVLGALCMVIGLAMPVLEFLPFTSSIAAGMVSLMALAMLAGDGLLAAAGIGLAVLAVSAVAWLI